MFTDDRINDENLKQDHSITRPFYETSQTYGYSCGYLGYMYLRGKGVKKNISKAIELFESVFSNGCVDAGMDLAYIYEPLDT